MKLITVGRLARDAGVTRTSLLYYERLGLLRASARSDAGYRLYGEAAVEQLRAIRIYREAGVPVKAIQQLLGTGHHASTTVLEERLFELDRQVQQLRGQQRLLARLLAQPAAMGSGRLTTKAGWVAMLRNAGFSDDDMDEWHRGFEADAPPAHQRFLEALGLPAGDIARVRAASRRATRPARRAALA